MPKRKGAPSPRSTTRKSSVTPKAPVVAELAEPFVVGVGASAGGLEALQRFFSNMPTDLNAAFVVVQHLSPDFKSFMVELLSKHTRLPVCRAAHDVKVERNHVYLIPPKATLTIAQGRLQLGEQDSRRGLSLPIDNFFRSLAEDQQHRAIAVVLSGTGSDGTAGVRAIKEAGGLVMVQSEDSAQFDGMPRSAIGTGLADYVLSPEQMPAQLANYLQHPFLTKAAELSRRSKTVESEMGELFRLISQQCGVDFSQYKPATVDRRIERRMSVCQIGELNQYLRYLRNSPREINLLFNELLIGVTSFFRDREVWDALEKDVLPEVLKNSSPDEPFRAWVAGCSTGEEAYSLAIVISELLEKLRLPRSIKIFATDISKDALTVGGRGYYTLSEVAGVSPERLHRYFVQEKDGFRVSTRIREMVVFAYHNLLNDPPFTRLSYVSCRNLLIYLQPSLQHRALSAFNFGLREDGVMLLGSSESIGDATDRFQPINTRLNLYRNRRIGHVPAAYSQGRATALAAADPSLRSPTTRPLLSDTTTLDGIYQTILSDYAPPCLIVDERDDIVHLIGNAGAYLKHPAGGFTRNLYKLTSHSFSNALRAALLRARKEADTFTYENVRYKEGGKTHVVRLRVRGLPDRRGNPSGLRIVSIEEQGTVPAADKTKIRNFKLDDHSAQRISDLERDLMLTRDSLQTTVQELETSNEEIQAANEELLASNEELQSTNEELQSVNEELHTVNQENQSRIEELTHLTNDINNLLATASVGVFLIDAHFRIRRASRSALSALGLTEADIGAPIETLARLLKKMDLSEIADRVIRTGQSEECEVEREGRWWLLRCATFRTEMKRTEGVVLSIIDITERHHNEGRLRLQTAITQSVLDAMDASVAILDRTGRIIYVNKTWRTAAEKNGPLCGEGLAVGVNYFDVCRANPGNFGEEVRMCLLGMEKVLRGDLPSFEHEYACHSQAQKRWVRLHAMRVEGPEPGLAVAHFNITPLKEAETLVSRKQISANGI